MDGDDQVKKIRCNLTTAACCLQAGAGDPDSLGKRDGERRGGEVQESWCCKRAGASSMVGSRALAKNGTSLLL